MDTFQMCSQEEIQFRIKVGLVSIFELDSLTKAFSRSEKFGSIN